MDTVEARMAKACTDDLAVRHEPVNSPPPLVPNPYRARLRLDQMVGGPLMAAIREPDMTATEVSARWAFLEKSYKQAKAEFDKAWNDPCTYRLFIRTP
jgi:hypothetical protein